MPKELYKHDFSGAYAPGGLSGFNNNTFSVGIFQWVPKANGKGLKKSAVKVRVKGYVSQPEKVYEAAKRICAELDAGTYTGKRYVSV